MGKMILGLFGKINNISRTQESFIVSNRFLGIKIHDCLRLMIII